MEGSEDRAKKQSEIEKGLEDLRFSKIRFRGNSTYFCWELMKRTGIIEGKTQELKQTPKPSVPLQTNNFETTPQNPGNDSKKLPDNTNEAGAN